MGSRKIDNFIKPMSYVSGLWVESVKKVTPNEKGQKRVTICVNRSQDLSKKCLNPSEIDLEALIRAGVQLDPKAVASTFNITDAADIDVMRNSKAPAVFDYIEKNKEAILASVQAKSE